MSSGSKRRLLSWAAAIIASIAALQIAPPARAQNPDDIAAPTSRRNPGEEASICA